MRRPLVRRQAPLALFTLLTSATALRCGDTEPAPACPTPLPEAITEAALVAHMDALAAIAASHDGNRAAASEGYTASLDYVEGLLKTAGYSTHRQEFPIESFEVGEPAILASLSPEPVDYVNGIDFFVAPFSAAGDISSTVTAVDLSLGLGNQSNSGCEEEDFVGFPSGDIALVQRGACTYQTKEKNAAAAGAVGLLIFNQGDTDDRQQAISPRLSSAAQLPTLGLSYALGAEFADISIADEGLQLHLIIDAQVVINRTENLLAELPGRNDDGVIMIGAHLDSVPVGPGINDNGSGSVATLELGIQLARCELQQPVRLAFWGAEELGLLGSSYYVEKLPSAAIEAIALYLNLDMIASPNSSRFLYDGDGSAFGEVGPPGSAEIESALAKAYDELDLATLETAFNGRSDYGPFIAAGVPSGGIFTGAEGQKSEAEVADFGGITGPYDPCYHRSCDDGSNYDRLELLINTRAVATIIQAYSLGHEPLPH